jgi:hypothetical protein
LRFGILAGDFRRPAPGDKVIDFGFGVEAKLVFPFGTRIRAEETSVAPPKRSGLHPTSSGTGGWVAPSTLATAAAYGLPGT